MQPQGPCQYNYYDRAEYHSTLGKDFLSLICDHIFLVLCYSAKLQNNVAGANSMIGIVTDAEHHNIKNVKCSGNTPKCKT